MVMNSIALVRHFNVGIIVIKIVYLEGGTQRPRTNMFIPNLSTF